MHGDEEKVEREDKEWRDRLGLLIGCQRIGDEFEEKVESDERRKKWRGIYIHVCMHVLDHTLKASLTYPLCKVDKINIPIYSSI